MERKSEILIFLRSLYTVIEDLLGFNNHKIIPLQILLTFSATFLASILCIICITPFFIFYHILNLYLKFKIGKKYVGLLKGQDSVTECPSNELVINFVMIINRNESYENFVKCVLNYVRKAQKSCVKLSYTIHRCLGYLYFTKTDLNIENYLSILNYEGKEFITKEILHNFLKTNCLDQRLIKNKMWHLTMFKQPIKWDKTNGLIQQAFICTVRHSFSDGISILGFLKNKVLEEMKLDNNFKEGGMKKFIPKEYYVYKNCFLPHDYDARIKPSYQSGDFLSFFNEESIKYVPIVKNIKEKLNVKFSDVLVSAISSSIMAYAQKKNINLCKHIGSITISPYQSKNKELLSGNYNYDNITNYNGTLHFSLPENPSLTLIEQTLKISKTCERALNASEVIVSQVLTKFFYLLPTQILTPFLNSETQPACFELSNMANIKSCSIGRNSLETAVFFTSQFFKVGFLFGLISIGDKFHFSLKSDRGMVENQEELDEILRDVFYYLDQLYEEVNCL